MATDNIEVFRGDDKSLNLTLKDAAGTAIDITGYTIFFTVKSSTDTAANDDGALISKTVTSHTDAAAGESTISLTGSDTDISEGTYVYDIQTKDASGAIQTLVKANFIVKTDVTKRTT